MPPFFEGPRLKVERAKGHIAEFCGEVFEFATLNPYSIVIEGEGEGWCALTVRVSQEFPREIPAIIGDAVHNLRGALDLLACDLVRLNGQSVEKVYFPFSIGGGKDFERVIKQRHIDRAAPDVVDIIRALKPYKGGNDDLRAIHDLDILDKHEMLIPITQLATIKDLTMTQGDSPVFSMVNCTFGPMKDGAVFMSIPTPDNLKVGQKFDASFDVTFDKGQPFQFQSVLPVLHQLSELVNGIINTFAEHCVATDRF